MILGQDEITVLSHAYREWLIENIMEESTNGMWGPLLALQRRLMFEEPHTAVISKDAPTPLHQAIRNLKMAKLRQDVYVPVLPKKGFNPYEQ